jgi:hypothetical protein
MVAWRGEFVLSEAVLVLAIGRQCYSGMARPDNDYEHEHELDYCAAPCTGSMAS